MGDLVGGGVVSAAEREAERRFPLWLPTGDYEIDREDYSELDAEWQNADTERDRAHFVQGAEWQAERDAEVTDEMVEAGARALVRLSFAIHGPDDPSDDLIAEHTVEPIREQARVVLEAVIGKEQAGEL